MSIAKILELNPKDIWPVYRELAWAGLEYRMEARRQYGTHYLFPEAPRPGRPRNIALAVLVTRLRGIYKQCTGREPACYWSEIDGAYRGDLLMLFELVAKERPSGGAVRRVMRSIHQTKTVKRQGPKTFPPKGTWAAFVLEVFRA